MKRYMLSDDKGMPVQLQTALKGNVDKGNFNPLIYR